MRVSYAPFVAPIGGIAPGVLAWRALVFALILGAETILASLFIDSASLTRKSGFLTVLLRDWGPWIVRLAIGFAALFTAFAYLKYKAALATISDKVAQAPIHRGFLAAHFCAIAIFAQLSAMFYGSGTAAVPTDLIAAGWMLAGSAATVFLGVALAPWPLWIELVRRTGKLSLYAFAAAILACYAGAMSRALWLPAAGLTFQLVKLLLSPFVREMILDPAHQTIGTTRFAVIVAPECSGLEGAALFVMFAVVWLWLFRDEIRFPRSLAVIPAGVVVLFLLNAVRIAALILIGHGGAPDIAIGGFHSQAGWIAFCSVAFGLTVAAPRVPWLALRPLEQEIVNPVAPYLVPFLTILATGFLSRAVSADFEWLYPMRFFSALVALWLFRRSYSKMDWKFGWFALVVGTAVFLMWIAMDRFTPGAGRMPSALAGAPAWAKGSWIACRIAAAVITVPIAEELAFRGFLLRRLNSADFESVSFRSFTWFSLLASSILFGILHGQRWVAGSAAGVLFGLAARQKGRLGDAVAAHAVTNVLLGVYVLVFQEWYLW